MLRQSSLALYDILDIVAHDKDYDVPQRLDKKSFRDNGMYGIATLIQLIEDGTFSFEDGASNGGLQQEDMRINVELWSRFSKDRLDNTTTDERFSFPTALNKLLGEANREEEDLIHPIVPVRRPR